MIDCLEDNIGEESCSVCNHPHTEFGALPPRPLTLPECGELAKGSSIDGIMPIFRIEDKYEFDRVIPAIVLVTGLTVRLLWVDPNDDSPWVIVREETDVELPYSLGKEMGEAIRESTYAEEKIEGHRVVTDDKELLNYTKKRSLV